MDREQGRRDLRLEVERALQQIPGGPLGSPSAMGQLEEAVDRLVDYKLVDVLWAPIPETVDSRVRDLSGRHWASLEATEASYEEKVAMNDRYFDTVIGELEPKTRWLYHLQRHVYATLNPSAIDAVQNAVVSVVASGISTWLEANPEPPGDFEREVEQGTDDEGANNVIDLMGWLEASVAGSRAAGPGR